MTTWSIADMTVLPPASAVPRRRILLILDLNGTLVRTKHRNRRPTLADPPLPVPEYKDGNFLYFVRPGLHKFLSRCFDHFDVAIWTSASPSIAKITVNTVLTVDEVQKLKFCWDNDHAIDCESRNPYLRGRDVAISLKDLRCVWRKFGDLYDDTNTVLVDDSPYKQFINPDYTGLFASTFQHDREDGIVDDFLLGLLWPCLKRLSSSTDVRYFLAYSEPLWSKCYMAIDKRQRRDIYALLKKEWEGSIEKIPLRKYNIFDLSTFEISWEKKLYISQLPAFETMDTKKLVDVAVNLGSQNSDQYRKKTIPFVKRILWSKSNLPKFRLPPKGLCFRHAKVDPSGYKLTCFYSKCEECLFKLKSRIKALDDE